ncbi:hypothetical protein CM49_01822 [Paenibacillus sp. P1XP2]|nr:hypothetical protein CM49_01822 [Paenibacillus sp. P1XP2]
MVLPLKYDPELSMARYWPGSSVLAPHPHIL